MELTASCFVRVSLDAPMICAFGCVDIWKTEKEKCVCVFACVCVCVNACRCVRTDNVHNSISIHAGMQGCVGDSIRGQKRGEHKRQAEKEWKRDWWRERKLQLCSSPFVSLHWLPSARLPHCRNAEHCVWSRWACRLSFNYCRLPTRDYVELLCYFLPLLHIISEVHILIFTRLHDRPQPISSS